jgi:NitT/TauT family transport system substrate-binding protein
MRTTRGGSRRHLLAVLLVLLAAGTVACGDESDTGGSSADPSEGESPDEPVTVRLGYFPNVTHAPGIVGDLGGLFEESVGDNVTIETSTFNAGPEAVEALFAEALDLTLIGPNPAINAFAQSDGEAIRIVSGTTSGGAFLVVRDGIDAPEDLEGLRIATPQLGNTQDVALRAWLKDEGFETDDAGGGDVSIQPQANGDALGAFIAGDLDGAWVPEPWATRFIQEGGAKVLVDEADLWPGGEYVTTHLIVRTAFLEDHPDVVKAVIEGLADAIDLIESDPGEGKRLTNKGIQAVTDKALSQEVLDASWKNLVFTLDPIASSLATSAEDAQDVGLLDPVDLESIYDLTLLNEVLADRGEESVEGL